MIRRKTSLLLAAVLAASLAPFPAASPAAEPAPAWQLAMIPFPTNFAPGEESSLVGPTYFLIATNVGDAPTGGPITLEAILPEGVVPDVIGGDTSDPESPNPVCGPPVGQTVTCTVAGPLHPGRWSGAKIGVDVEPGAEGALIAQASVSGGGAASASATAQAEASTEPLPFDFLAGPSGFTALLTNGDGSPATQAGSHPSQMTINLGFPSEKIGNSLLPTGHLRDLRTDLPRGLVVNPTATSVLCTAAQLTNTTNPGSPGCPDASQIGTVTTTTMTAAISNVTDPLYNMVPPPGVPAMLGFHAVGAGIFVHIAGSVRSDGDYGLSAEIDDILALPTAPILSTQAQLWGDPSGSSHDQIRGMPSQCLGNGGSCSVEPQNRAFLTMPTQCTGPITTKGSADSWQEPGVFKERSSESADLEGNPVGVEGCNQLDFEPTIASKPTTGLAESPSGLDFHLHQPQNTEFEGLSTAAVKDMEIALPEGMTLNPSAADGIEGCSSEQIGLITDVGESPARIDQEPNECPDASRIGTLEVTSPALAQYDSENKIEIDPETGEPILDPLNGSVHLAEPFDNPFDSLLAIYLVLEDEKTGIVAKVPAEITADPDTGQLVTRVTENPQLPLEDVEVHLFGGARAPLITPPVCGTHTTTSTLVPWSSPEGADAHPSDSFATTANPGGGSCSTSLAGAANNPSFSAGTIAPLAGAFSAFAMKLTRSDATQRFSGLETTLPPGLIGKLAGLSRCSEAQIAQARAREAPSQGRTEIASPSCPASSKLGEIDVSAGAGPTPLYVKAHAYLAGPYKGAPLSLVVITPAVAGPYDLGAVVIRVTLALDPRTAQIKATSDPLPTILEGIPLDVRGASLKLDRPEFTLNPTSCDPMAITGLVTTIPGAIAPLRSPFQVGGCSRLGFKPKLSLRLKGGTKRGGHPAFQAVYRPRPGDANLKDLVVRLPRSAFLDQAHIRTICTRVQFAQDACPEGSRYGHIIAWTPLLDEPLQGAVYLRSSEHQLPDLVFDLHGVVDVEVATRIDSVQGGIRASIESAPDAPIAKVLLRMRGADKGLIVNSRDICKAANRADVKLDAQNGKVHDSKPRLKARCGKDRKGKHRRARFHPRDP